EINSKSKTVKSSNEHERVKYEFTGPLVFQCIKCKVIVGDTFAFVAAERELNSVALYAKPHNVRVGTDLIWSKEGADIGRILQIALIIRFIRYECGSYIDPEAVPLDTQTLPSARMQQMTINKLQDMVMMLHQRLAALEYNMVVYYEKEYSKHSTANEFGIERKQLQD
ncbi:20058_t:CDS:2, partial [Dentiscutata erythropus]